VPFLGRRGQLNGGYNVLIASHAGGLVMTGNPREFQWVEGLRTEDWLAG
jgi:tRNA(fMet)-specific endonuclease VapC